MTATFLAIVATVGASTAFAGWLGWHAGRFHQRTIPHVGATK